MRAMGLVCICTAFILVLGFVPSVLIDAGWLLPGSGWKQTDATAIESRVEESAENSILDFWPYRLAPYHRYSVIVAYKYSLGQREFKGFGEIARLSERFDAEQASIGFRAGKALSIRYRSGEPAISAPIRPGESTGKMFVRMGVGLLIAAMFYWFGQRLLRQWDRERKTQPVETH